MSSLQYKLARKKYLPKKVQTLFIAESPPDFSSSGVPRYFFFDNSDRRDFLYRGIIGTLFPSHDLVNKPELLALFKEKGYYLLDAVETPINAMSPSERDSLIWNNSLDLISRTSNVCDKDTKIILIKKNIFDILASPLRLAGFNVANTEALPFPACGNQRKFKLKLEKLLK